MEIYMHREIGKRGSLDMIRDIVMINEEGEEKEEKDVKKRKRKRFFQKQPDFFTDISVKIA